MLCPSSNGQLLADIHGSIPQHEFKAMLIKAISGQIYEATAVTTSETMDHTREGLPSGSNGSVVNCGSILASLEPAVQTVSKDRNGRLEVDKKEKEAAGKAETSTNREAVQAEAEETPYSRSARQLNYARTQKNRQIDEQKERERISRSIENNKLEWKHKQDVNKALSPAENETNDEPDMVEDQQISGASIPPKATSSSRCAIQVRLFDGSTIRSSFHSSETLSTSVRRWVDQNRTDGETPYILKQVVVPMPSRSITISEEVGSLQSLASLLVPL